MNAAVRANSLFTNVLFGILSFFLRLSFIHFGLLSFPEF